MDKSEQIIQNLKNENAELRRLHEDTKSLLKAAFVQSSVPMVLVTAPKKVITILNSAAEDILGIQASDYLGKSLDDMSQSWIDISPDGSTLHRNDWPLYQALSGITKKNVEWHILRHDGSKKCVLASGAPIYNPEGILIAAMVIFPDITDRRSAEEEVKVTSELLKLFIANSPIHSFIKEVNPQKSLVLHASENYVDMIGIPGSQMVGKTMEQLFPPEFAVKITEDDWNVVSQGDVLRLDENLNDRNYITIKYPITLGEKTLLAGYTIDITQRQKAENALAEEKERLSVTLRCIGDGVITTDTQGLVVLMNKVAEELCGMTQREAQGKPLSEVFKIINENTREPEENPAFKVLSEAEVIEPANPVVLLSQDGSEKLVTDSFAPIKDVHGAILGVVIVFRDITEKQKMWDAIQRTDKLGSLAVLAGGIAHDFNNLLGGIFGYISLAQVTAEKDPYVTEYLNKAVSVFARAKDLTQQLLTFSSGGAPKKTLGNLGTLLKNTAAFALSGSSISPDIVLEEDLWLCDFDENQMGQVFDNLIINARQAMPLGGKIRISAQNKVLKEGEIYPLKPGNYVQILISDTGIGIPKNLLKKIFDPFFTTKLKGHGLGLATCNSIVQKHSGTITVESDPGKGCVFSIFLPASPSTVPSEPPPQEFQHWGEGTILVMDDEDFMRDILKKMLQSMGYTVVTVKNGTEAVKMVSQESGINSMKAAILDLTVPGEMGGQQAADLIKSIRPTLPLFAASGFSEDPIMSNPKDYGFTDSIRKPFQLWELAQLLARNI